MTAFPEFSNTKPLPEREQDVLKFWKQAEIFRKSGEATANGPRFVFFEGPPTANGRPGIHHVLSRVFKDVYIRFHGQRGCHVPRRAGWDCHGLPVEREVEKELGIESKAEIEEKYGVAKFNELCRKSVLRYVEEWNRFSERMAFWVDLDDPYFTMDDEFIEAVWGLLKIIWERGLIYQGYKVVPLDPVMGTTMSDAEVDLGYKETEDPSLTVRFRIDSEREKRFGENAFFLVWTTTPWTLPSNVALALAPNETYVLVERSRPDEEGGGSERLICAKSLYDEVFAAPSAKIKKKSSNKNEVADAPTPPSIVAEFPGRDLIGVPYRQLLDYVRVENPGPAFQTVAADFVTMDTGTGIVHIAPAYGADDLEVGNQHGLPVLHAVGLDGKFVSGTPHAGVFFKDADKDIVRELKEAGHVWRSERYKHNYPFGYRTGVPLIYYAKNAWYIRTTDLKKDLIKNNATIRWVPEHIKHGRFGNWLENNRDWALSRERYWGTPLPVWTDGEGGFRCIGSVKELETLTGKKFQKLDLHRPHVDDITFKDPETGKTMRRVPEVIDCWFDSGAMPYAQWGWPARGAEAFANYFPADFISEAIDQTRGWFYTLLAISTMVSGKSSYKNVVCLGHVLDEKGEKMSKSKGNVVLPQEVFDRHGADGIRWYFLTNAPPGNSRRVGKPGSKDGDPVAIVHGFLNMLINSVSFFSLYANVDGMQPAAVRRKDGLIDLGIEHQGHAAPPFAKRPAIDRWILSSLQDLIHDVTEALNDYDCQGAGKRIEEFTDTLSNWYIRRNRRRFWKGEPDADKIAAFDTLYRCLVALARLIAPFTPFLAESIFQSLVAQTKIAGDKDLTKTMPESVQLGGWPHADRKNMYDAQALREGDVIKQAAYLGRAARMESGVKVRQPLARMMIHCDRGEDRKTLGKAENQEVLLDELNVKSIEFLDDSAGILDYRVKPNLPRIGKALGPRVRDCQQFLKDADGRELAAKIKAGQAITVPVADGEDVVLEGEDLILESLSAEGVSGAEGDGLLVAFDVTLTPELIREGMARDLVRNIQELRKQSGLEVTDRIVLNIQAGGELAKAVEEFGEVIAGETLAGFGDVKQVVGNVDVTVEGEAGSITIGKK